MLGTFVLVMSTAGALFWILTDRLSAETADQQINEILDTTEQTALSTISNSAESIYRARNNIVRLAQSAEHGTDPASEQPMFQALQYVPELSGVFISNSSGDFQFVHRTADGFRVKRVDADGSPTGDRQVSGADFDANFGQTSPWEVDPDDDYDARTRPWYIDSQALAGEPVWTTPYHFFSSKEPGITHAVASTGNREDWVVGVDVQLQSLVVLLSELSGRIPGEVLLYDGEGMALTSRGLVDLDQPAGPDDHEARSALAAAQRESGTRELTNSVIEYRSGNEDHTVRITRIPIGGSTWSLLTDVSDDDVPVPVSGLVNGLRLLALGLSILAAFTLALLLVPATEPIGRLERDATIDPLTSLPNRRAILQRGEALSARRTPFSVAMIDVDKFKLVNDRHGHSVGDEVLCELAHRLAGDGCEVGRLGGEEFVVLLQAGSAADNTEVADSLRRAIDADPIATAVGPIDLTISVGIASHEHNEAFTTVLKRADGALLEAKLHGRNQVVAAEPSAPRNAPSIQL